MRIGKNDSIKICSKELDLHSNSFKKINYEQWKTFIEANKDYFIWYENTEDGMQLGGSINKVPDWAKEGVLYRLNKSNAYSTNKIVKKSFEFIVRYFSDEGIIKIDIEKNMSIKIAEILLEMTKYLNGKLTINDTEELENIEQLS